MDDPLVDCGQVGSPQGMGTALVSFVAVRCVTNRETCRSLQTLLQRGVRPGGGQGTVKTGLPIPGWGIRPPSTASPLLPEQAHVVPQGVPAPHQLALPPHMPARSPTTRCATARPTSCAPPTGPPAPHAPQVPDYPLCNCTADFMRRPPHQCTAGNPEHARLRMSHQVGGAARSMGSPSSRWMSGPVLTGVACTDG